MENTDKEKVVRKPKASKTLKQLVNERANGAKVKETLVDQLAAEETKRRTAATAKLLDLIDVNELDRRKIKSRYAGYTLDEETGEQKGVGEPIYSDQEAQQLKKLIEVGNRQQKALTLALEENDFSKVFELTESKDQAKSDPK